MSRNGYGCVRTMLYAGRTWWCTRVPAHANVRLPRDTLSSSSSAPCVVDNYIASTRVCVPTLWTVAQKLKTMSGIKVLSRIMRRVIWLWRQRAPACVHGVGGTFVAFVELFGSCI